MKITFLVTLLLVSCISYSQHGNIIKPSGRVINSFAILDSNKAKDFYRKFSRYMKPMKPKRDYYDYEKAKTELNIISHDGVIKRILKNNVVINIETMELVTTEKLWAGSNAEPLVKSSAIIVNGFAILDSTKANNFIDKFSAYFGQKKKYYNYEKVKNEYGVLAGKRILVCTLKENVIMDMEKLELINF
jgi:hypothetical protein